VEQAQQTRVVALVGAELEENLSLRYLAAALERAGLEPRLLAFSSGADQAGVVEAVLAEAPLAVGVSIPFQHHARELMALLEAIRGAGYRGHLTVGGHFATFEHAALLRDLPALDSAVRHEGEETIVELCQRLLRGEALSGVPGLVTRGEGGPVVGPPRALPELDALAPPLRPAEPHQVLGVRSAPILGSRGCTGACAFCCIHAYGAAASGPRYRTRSPEAIAEEMAIEHERRGVRLFIFHDDNFLVHDRARNLERCQRLGEALRARGLAGEVGLVVKCRPDDVERELFALLRELGMIRAYVGIESASREGVACLQRGMPLDAGRRALAILGELEVYCSFNLLLFHPDATLGSVEAELAFLADFCEAPFNFCRAEVYAGTPLQARLAAEGRLAGSYLAWSYELADPRAELLFRVVTTAFATRNFKPDGIANLNMGLRYDAEVVRRFHPRAWDAALGAELRGLSRRIGEDSVAGLRQALVFALGAELEDQASAKAFTLELARAVAAADLAFLGEVKALRRELERRIQIKEAA